MPDYYNTSCPICGKQFAPGDDIVVCPDCGTPHHRACYNELGHCALQERHAEGYSWLNEQAKADAGGQEPGGSRCSRCGSANPAESRFCNTCGYPLRQDNRGAQEQGTPFADFINNQTSSGAPRLDLSAEVTDGVTVRELADFIGPNSYGFIRRFMAMSRSHITTFNFSAFFFGGFYCFYRRMYKLGAALIGFMAALYAPAFYYSMLYTMDYMSTGVMVTEGDLYTKLNICVTVMRVAFFIISAVLGLMFNKLYMKYCISSIKEKKADARYSSCTASSALSLRCKGGVDKLTVFITIAVLFVIVMAVSYVLMNQYMNLNV